MYFEMRDATNPERLPEVSTDVIHNDVSNAVEIFLDEPINTPDSTVISPRLVMTTDEARKLWLQLGQALGPANVPVRTFEAHGRIGIDYSVTFTEAQAREWFPDVLWDDPDRSHAGDIETEYVLNPAEPCPVDFWDAVRAERTAAIDAYLAEAGWAGEVVSVVEL